MGVVVELEYPTEDSPSLVRRLRSMVLADLDLILPESPLKPVPHLLRRFLTLLPTPLPLRLPLPLRPPRLLHAPPLQIP